MALGLLIRKQTKTMCYSIESWEVNNHPRCMNGEPSFTEIASQIFREGRRCNIF